MSDSVQPHRQQPTSLSRPWDSQGKNTGVGCHFLLQCMKVKSLSRVWLLVTPWTAAYQAPASMGFSRQEYWSGVPLPSPNLSLAFYKKLFFLHWSIVDQIYSRVIQLCIFMHLFFLKFFSHLGCFYISNTYYRCKMKLVITLHPITLVRRWLSKDKPCSSKFPIGSGGE